MSGFKTPTAMSPPKKQNSSPRFRKPKGPMHPYDATPALLQAFEQLKAKEDEAVASAKSSHTTLPSLPTVEEASLSSRGRPGTNRASSATFPPAYRVREAQISSYRRTTFDQDRAASFSPVSAISLNSVINGHRPHTAPLIINKDTVPITHNSNATTAVNSPLSSYGRMSSAVDGGAPCSKPSPLSTSRPDLEVYKRHESNGRLMVCEAREQHCSLSVEVFMGEQTGLRSIAELKRELLETLRYLGGGDMEQARAGLKVVTGNMLERIVAWDLNKAEALEQSDVPLLSTVPTTESMNKVDAIYILKMFRSGMMKIPIHDIRSKVGILPDDDLMALLHFTLLVSRPVLTWELDLDEI